MRRFLTLTAVATTLSLLVAASLATGAFAQDSGSKKKVVFTLGSDSDVDSMNQFISVSSGYTIFPMTYDLLLNFGVDDLTPQPGLATEVPSQENGGISADGLTYTFHIQPGMKWSDGQPFTAKDIAYTYNRVIQDHEGCCFSYLKLVTGIDTPDDTTLVLHTSKPTFQMLDLYIYIYPEHVWSKISTDDAKTYENFPGVTSGPFVPVEWKKGQFMRLERNPNYHGPQPNIDEIVYKVFNNLDAAVAALKSGQVDFIDLLTANLFNSLKGQSGIATHSATAVGFSELGINTGSEAQGDGNPVLQDPEFRKALALAVDKQELVDKITLGYATPGTTIVSPFYGNYHLDIPQDQQIPFDIAGANQILDQAGYADTDNNGIRNAKGGGADIVLRYFVRTENEDTVNTAPFVQAWWKQIGIGTKVTALSDNKLTDVIIQGDYDIFHWGWGGDPDPDFILSVMTCGQRPELNASGHNVGGIWSDSYFCNQQYDQQYDQQKTLVDIQQRVDLIHQMQQEIYDAVPYIVLWNAFDLQAYNNGWTGFQPQPAPNGDLLAQYGPFAYSNLRLKAGATASGGTQGIPAGVWLGIVAALLIVIGVVFAVRRRGVGDEDRA